jgi:Tol biopolymer transport system component
VKGGTPVVLNRLQSRAPHFSPDGSLLLCETRDDAPAAKWKACLLSSSDGVMKRTFEQIPVRSHAQWMPGGHEISFIETQGGISNIFAYNLFRGTVRQLTHFREEQISNFEWSHDGRRLALVRGTSTSDAFLYLRKGAH